MEGGTIMNLEIPTVKISRKEPDAVRKDGFTVTYEYHWPEHTSNAQTYKVTPTTDYNDASVPYSWNGSISFYLTSKLEVKSMIKVDNLTCSVCRTSVVQSRCLSCRKKIHTYKCQKCGTDIPNPEYGGS